MQIVHALKHNTAECGGVARYREFLRGMTWTREPIIPECSI